MPNPVAGDENRVVPLPLLIVVSGPAGTGTTTLAHTLARAIPCPAICRDAIKEGLVHATHEYTPAPGDAMQHRTFETFFGVVGFLVEAGATHVAEAAFQHRLWEAGLAPFVDGARIRIVHCRVDAAVAWRRIARRADESAARRAIHGDYSLLASFDDFKERFDAFDRVALPVPSLEIDTTDGYDPPVEEIVAFLNTP